LSAAHKKPADVGEDVEDEKKAPNSSASTASNATSQDSELDPVGLKKAFKFAAWSSVIMVRGALQGGFD
jgi:hypothetical protein